MNARVRYIVYKDRDASTGSDSDHSSLRRVGGSARREQATVDNILRVFCLDVFDSVER
jgi:hypothetical protein